MLGNHRGKKFGSQPERSELGEQQCSPISFAFFFFFFLLENDAVLVWQLSLERCIYSQIMLMVLSLKL